MKLFGAAVCILLFSCVFLCGAGAAIDFYSDAVVNPSGDLKLDEIVSVDMTFSAVGGELSGLSFYTPLDKADWKINVYNGNTRVFFYTPNGNSFELPVWPNREDMMVSVIVSLTGRVSLKMSGKSVSVLEMCASDGSFYATPEQRVLGRVLVSETEVPSASPSVSVTSEPVLRFSYDKKAFSVTPSEISAEKRVEGEMVISVPKKMRAEIVLSSPLENVHFKVVQMCPDGRRLAYLQGNGSPYVIPASTVYVDEPYTFRVTFSGTVPKELDGKEVSLLSIDAGEHGSFVSGKQQVGVKQQESQASVTAVQTGAETVVPTVVQTEAVSEPQSFDLIAMFVNWIKSLFG